ncbi:sensor histidine kinase [Jannaschia aquimarina]|uniref:sensor histidine kinase n=1 Tax=Jannaschia aquimarina TaxID=935700 RepID=UPI000B71FBE0|nr:sensor histidine kinase [Jannaschia aquimarina]SNT22679.1 Two-component sensor histidine kinase, contains HisKA and HATPase domains [Jannaschia aquimarina]
MRSFGWRHGGLTLRVLVFLSLALMPLGAIAFWQTQRLAAQTIEQAESTLLSLSEHAANPLQADLQRGMGALHALAASFGPGFQDGETCDRLLARFMSNYDLFSYAAFIGTDGRMTCSSDGRQYDFSGDPPFQRALADQRSTITVNENAPLSGRPVLILTSPMRERDALLGFLSVSIPIDRIGNRPQGTVLTEPLHLVTFNNYGEVLTRPDGEAAMPSILPADVSLETLAREGDRSFVAADSTGEERVFANVAVVPGLVFALTSWPLDVLGGSTVNKIVLTGLMPVLMWLASLLVAVLALERLVFRHIRSLSRQMNAFARRRSLIRTPMLTNAGSELAQIEADFRAMAGAILQDEALLENNLREKNILLKEVHHRVKNNLQLISSIMNMQARRLKGAEARDVLRRMQDRVMGLAAVHRSLYQTEDMGRIDAGALVGDLSRQIVVSSADGGAIEFDADVDQVLLDADRAVALSLTVSEAMTNAVEHARAKEGEHGAIHLALKREEGSARLTISNGCASGGGGADDGGTGLGLQLVTAFARQLNGKLDVSQDEGTFRLDLLFPIEGDKNASLDY